MRISRIRGKRARNSRRKRLHEFDVEAAEMAWLNFSTLHM